MVWLGSSRERRSARHSRPALVALEAVGLVSKNLCSSLRKYFLLNATFRLFYPILLFDLQFQAPNQVASALSPNLRSQLKLLVEKMNSFVHAFGRLSYVKQACVDSRSKSAHYADLKPLSRRRYGPH